MAAELPAPSWTPTMREYHADRSRWSASMLKTFRESPSMAWHRYIKRDIEDDASTKSLVLGSLVNMLLLEPERRGELYLVVGCQDRRAKAFRDAAASEETREVVTSAELGEATAMADAVLRPVTTAARVARRLLVESEGHFEFSHRWDELGGDVPCKCRVDKLAVVAGRPTKAELKTSVAADPEGFARQAWNLGYHCQNEHNLRGLADLLGERPPEYHVVIGNTPPHEVGVYQLDPEFQRLGKRQIDHDLRSLAASLARDPAEPWCAPWESLEDSGGAIIQLEPPAWAARSMEGVW